jgi:hypothetical protein
MLRDPRWMPVKANSASVNQVVIGFVDPGDPHHWSMAAVSATARIYLPTAPSKRDYL